VLRLKEIYSNISQDKERLAEENRQLKQLLTQNGMSMSGALSGGILDETNSNPSVGYSASVSGSASYAPAPSSHTSAFTPPPAAAGAAAGGGQRGSPHTGSHGHSHSHSHGRGQSSAPVRNPGLDYDQAGIDFVLTYDNPSKAYMSPPHQ